MSRNPYAPPQASVSPAEPQAQAAGGAAGTDVLYSPNQMFAASFIAAPIAAAWFAAANFRVIGQPIKARRIVLWGVLATILVIGLAFVLPNSTPHSVLPLAYSFGVRALAENAFKAVLQDHSSAGGRKGSWWRVVGVSILFLLPIIVCLVGVVLALVSLGVPVE
ncbi:MAG TPA: hypothetical protein VKB34_00665 [Povalibacter sp.]|nr:hypothetical protein [Povalibacter sp.]